MNRNLRIHCYFVCSTTTRCRCIFFFYAMQSICMEHETNKPMQASSKHFQKLMGFVQNAVESTQIEFQRKQICQINVTNGFRMAMCCIGNISFSKRFFSLSHCQQNNKLERMPRCCQLACRLEIYGFKWCIKMKVSLRGSGFTHTHTDTQKKP